MYVVRRHSRKLFFPAGLLALAWLPVLGGALLAARPELRRLRQRVLQVSVPPCQQHFTSYDGKQYSIYPPETYASPAQIDTMRCWQTVSLTANPWEDALSTRMASFLARQLQTAPDQDWGLRIQFGNRSYYRSLVAMLNTLDVVGLKWYWLDTRHEPTTLYALGTKPVTVNMLDDNVMFSDEVLQPSAARRPTTPLLAHLRRDWQHLASPATWRPLFGPDWRYSTLLLLLLPPAAAWQLRRLMLSPSPSR